MADPETYGHSFDVRLGAFISAAAHAVPALSSRLERAGVGAGSVASIADLDAIPILGKDDVIDLQRADPPFGGLVAAGARPRRVFQSPGPLYEVEPPGDDPWRWGSALGAAGFGAGDVVLNAFGYHLSPAGAMFEAACHSLGCTVVPAGVGSLDLQAQACLALGATAYVGLPSYLKALLDKADEIAAPGALRLQRAFVTAEPLPPSLREWLEARIPTLRQGYGTAETGNLGYECDEMEGLHVPDDALVQICDLSTGRALWGPEEGQVVVTVFTEEHPVVRFGTGDLSAWLTGSCPCGRPTPRLAGWLGRVGEAVKVRGMFLHPRQIHRVMDPIAGVAGYRFVIDREEHRDVLRCEVRPADGARAAAVVEAVRSAVRDGLRFEVAVEAVDSLESDDGPIVDRRVWE